LNLSNLPIQKLVKKIQEKEIPFEEYCNLKREQSLQGQDKLNLFISINTIENMLEALTKARGDNRNDQELPFMGVPFVLGDNICSSELKTTCASKMLSSYQPPFDATASLRLKNKGAFLLGKTNMEEFSVGSTGNSSFFNCVRNPLQEDRLAGSGAAAAIAAGIAALALASDARGELRQAASFCGVPALKPTAGRSPRLGLIDYASSLEQIGIMADRTLDLAFILESIAGTDPRDPASLKAEVPPYLSLLQENKEKPTFAVPEDWAEAPFLEEGIRSGFQKQLEALKEAGFKVNFVSLPHFKYASAVAEIISSVEAYSNLGNLDGIRFGFREEAEHLQELYFKTRSEGFSSKLKKFLSFGALNSKGNNYRDYFLKAQKVRSMLNTELLKSLSQYNLLLTPTTPFTAPLSDADESKWQMPDPACYYTATANLAGLPALTFPIKMAEKLPWGLQLVGKADNEATLFRAALLLEAEIGS
jgi:aspartyl-tRNA(Asn)/glutamyl-tRNA(Gln) amidotransferase subunit A